mgnify:CR=1 FL=1
MHGGRDVPLRSEHQPSVARPRGRTHLVHPSKDTGRSTLVAGGKKNWGKKAKPGGRSMDDALGHVEIGRVALEEHAEVLKALSVL